MQTRLSLVFVATLVVLGATLLMMRDRSSVADVRAFASQPKPAAGLAQEPTSAPTSARSDASPTDASASPMVHVDAAGNIKYVARAGDTVSQLAVALLGSDSKEHRDAIIAANPTLRATPDRVLAGQTYSIYPSLVQLTDNSNTAQPHEAAPAISAAARVSPNEADEARVKPKADANPTAGDKSAGGAVGPKLKYTAQSGDTVSSLASNLLGGDTKANRKGIVAGNASLQQDPDHMVVGQSYTIVARNGLAADPDAAPAKTPTTQPEADEAALLSVGRTLRYKAMPGDTVSKLAATLLGSDTQTNRDLIIKSNPGLKQDPDHLVAGQTYWIAAPVADAAR